MVSAAFGASGVKIVDSYERPTWILRMVGYWVSPQHPLRHERAFMLTSTCLKLLNLKQEPKIFASCLRFR
ncbi:hypothetical protein H6G97_35485 [Nostoc flagelliforme FACHB-838]|uniref:Uncharacterized protein n=1 Tax=Nostoc flagelliforme FACHB-838 TaxID=2692904 RepID=A0ABR8E080_9NOSO|nr:hypothetical protein [Nostoc flagelliforme FACHB-838]